MKRTALLSKFAVLLVLLALVLVVAITVQAGVPNGGAAGLAAARQGNGVPASPPDGGNIRDVPVGPPPTGQAVPLAPLEIDNEQLEANAAIQSDDFNWCTIDDMWNESDPLSDGTFGVEGTFTNNALLTIGVPSGEEHDIWYEGNKAPKVLQRSLENPTSFEVVVKFQSGMLEQYQMQGIAVQQADRNLLRFEFYSNGSSTWLFAAHLVEEGSTGMTPTVEYNQSVYSNGAAPLWMRVVRNGSDWTLYHSNDGTNWSPPAGIGFTHPLTVNSIGIYAANSQPKDAALDPPAHTAKFDYFFNTSSPITPEDGERNTLTVTVEGQGSVDTDKDPSIGENSQSYVCDEEVELTAVADTDWSFTEWAGDLTGSTNPETVTMDGPKEVTARFGGAGACGLTVTVSPTGSGNVAQKPPAPHQCDEVICLRPVPNPGWSFSAWSGPGANQLVQGNHPTACPDYADAETWHLTLSGPTQVTANFTEEAAFAIYLPIVVR